MWWQYAEEPFSNRDMKAKTTKKEFAIGLSVIVALAILFFGIDYLKGINLFKPANFYYAEYSNVEGLTIAAPVTIDGYKVGQVRDIEFNYNNPGKIRVLLALNKQLNLPEDSYATVAQSMLSGASINITVGHSPKYVERGGTINSREAGAGLMGTLQDEVMPQVSGILPKVDSLLYNLNMLAGDPALLQSIRRLDMITANVASATRGLDVTVNRQLPAVMGNARTVTAHIDSLALNLVELSQTLKALPLQNTMSNLEQTTGELSRFSAQLNNRESTLGQLMYDPELYNRLNRVTADIDSLIIDIKKNPKRYISIKLL